MWDDREYTFGLVVSEFFQRKNAKTRFIFKLFNALKLTEYDPCYSAFIGVEWARNCVIKVDKKAFARLLMITSIDVSLFHNQGNFPSHGFMELTPDTAVDVPLYGVDWDNIRLLTHRKGTFTCMCNESTVVEIKWVHPNAIKPQ